MGLLFIFPFHFVFSIYLFSFQTYYTLLNIYYTRYAYTIEFFVEPIIYHSRISRTTIHTHIFTI